MSTLGGSKRVVVQRDHGTPVLKGIARGVGVFAALKNLLIFGIILLCSLIILNFIWIQPWLKSQQVMQWKEVRCEIVESSVKPTGKRFNFSVMYEFEWDGIQRRSRQFGITEFVADDSNVIQELINQYPVGSQQACFVNAADPSESVLSRQWRWSVAELFWPLLFACLGAIGCGYSIRSGWKNLVGTDAGHFAPRFETETLLASSSQEDLSTDSHSSFQAARPNSSASGAATIPPLRSSMIVILAYLIVGCGLLALIVWNIVDFIADLRVGNVAWGQLLICAVLAYFAFRVLKDGGFALLIKGNPTTDLTIRPATLEQGKVAEISWEFQGNTARVNELVFRLVGIQATLEEGESQSKITQAELLNEVIFQTNQPNEIRLGDFRFMVPDIDRDAGELICEKLTWRIAIEGTQVNWPVNILLIYPVEVQ